MNLREIQARLAELGFDPGPIDGVRGPKTDAAVVAFKKSVGLRPRPYIGPITLEALFGDDLDHVRDADIPWMAEASRMRGLHEARDTSRLRAWFDRSVSWIDPREVPWCGAFCATVMRKWESDIALPENPLGARNWMKFGAATQPVFGSIVVFWRGSKSGWQGHVGFYHAEDDAAFHVLGGNQSNAVTVTRIGKERLLGARWPKGVAMDSRPVQVRSDGTPLSHNEA